jgi:hypothetical protein
MIEDARSFNPGRLVVVLALKIYEAPLWIPAQRGIIYESQGAELATNLTVSDTLQSLQK